MTAQDSPFIWPLRVFWEDTDAGGVVYHASYVRFFERARTEWLRAKGINQVKLREEHGVIFVVHSMDLRFSKPARLDDLLHATVIVNDVRSASFKVEQSLHPESDPSILLVSANVRIACIDAERWKPHSMPEFLLQEISRP
ncbi:MAG TPA: tol-pal system-associated acyl-CoA thioesterase [Dokdonella sp.]|uniref:tol-pal system-associated acyl-CoA thioesterase n=1 Tax=Dokdonella sp. TaxID=2291710 RepID=UPI002D7E2429|nr:tol-pal system-associated acyl-CoA thioesterase [Dokdonella sp.]HET9032043.1 tol-pal system-associated acyl-CoA thioesterase [Dokdonella sp.]